MSVQIVCDYCGDHIYRGQSYRVVRVEPYDARACRTMRDRTAHYHDEPCWERIESAVRAVWADDGPASAEPHNDPERWTDKPVAVRERIVLETIGDGRLTNRGIWEAVCEAHPGVKLYKSEIAPLTRRLVAAGEIVCEREAWRGRTRNRYHRRTDLDGPIADLDRAFREGDAA